VKEPFKRNLNTIAEVGRFSFARTRCLVPNDVSQWETGFAWLAYAPWLWPSLTGLTAFEQVNDRAV
jgi:hypothetical protein